MRRPSEGCVGSFSHPNLADSAAQTYSAKWFVIFFSDSAVGSFGEFPRTVDDQRRARNRKSRDENELAVESSRQSKVGRHFVVTVVTCLCAVHRKWLRESTLRVASACVARRLWSSMVVKRRQRSSPSGCDRLRLGHRVMRLVPWRGNGRRMRAACFGTHTAHARAPLIRVRAAAQHVLSSLSSLRFAACPRFCPRFAE